MRAALWPVAEPVLTKAQAIELPWVVAATVLGLLGFVAVILLGLAIIREVTR